MSEKEIISGIGEWATFWTAIIALATIVYVIGTFLLWWTTRGLLQANKALLQTTRSALILSALVALRSNGLINSLRFERMLRKRVPEGNDLMNDIAADDITEQVEHK